MSRCDDGRLAVDLVVEDVLAGELLQRLDQGPADEVGEADLAAARARHVVVDHDPVVDHQLRRDRSHAGRGRHGQRLIHVRGQGLGHAAQRGDRVLIAGVRFGGIRLRRRFGSLCGDRCLLGGFRGRLRHRLRADHGDGCGDRMLIAARVRRRRCRRGGGGLRRVVLQDGPPLLVDGVAISLELLVELVDEPGIGSEISVVRTSDAGHLVRHALSPSFIAEAFVHAQNRDAPGFARTAF